MTTSTTTTPTTNNIYLNDYKPNYQHQMGKISWQHHGNDYNHTLQLVVGLVVVLVVIYIYVNDYKPDYKPNYQHQMAKNHVNNMVTTW